MKKHLSSPFAPAIIAVFGLTCLFIPTIGYISFLFAAPLIGYIVYEHIDYIRRNEKKWRKSETTAFYIGLVLVLIDFIYIFILMF